MATYSIGKVSMSSKGDYSASESYTKLDIVKHNGGAYICKLACTGIEPGVSAQTSTYWDLICDGIKTISVAQASASDPYVMTVTTTSGSTFSFNLNYVIAANAVTTTKIADNNVTTAKIAASVGTLNKLLADSSDGKVILNEETESESGQYGTTLPTAGNAGRIFFKKVSS